MKPKYDIGDNLLFVGEVRKITLSKDEPPKYSVLLKIGDSRTKFIELDESAIIRSTSE